MSDAYITLKIENKIYDYDNIIDDFRETFYLDIPCYQDGISYKFVPDKNDIFKFCKKYPGIKILMDITWTWEGISFQRIMCTFEKLTEYEGKVVYEKV